MAAIDSYTRQEFLALRERAERNRRWGTVQDVDTVLRIWDRSPREPLSWLVEQDTPTVQAAARRVEAAIGNGPR